MKSIEHRIYVNGKLNNICLSDFALMCNVTNAVKTYGEHNVEVKHFETPVIDEKLLQEKREWLNTL